MNIISGSPSISNGIGVLKEKVAVGTQICETAKQLVIAGIAIKKISEIASSKGCRVLTAGTTIAAGVLHGVAGQILVGGSLIMIGSKEMYNIFGSNFDSSKLKTLVSDSRANLKMIQTLEEANQKSLDTLDNNLSIVDQNVEKMRKCMRKIRSLSAKVVKVSKFKRKKH